MVTPRLPSASRSYPAVVEHPGRGHAEGDERTAAEGESVGVTSDEQPDSGSPTRCGAFFFAAGVFAEVVEPLPDRSAGDPGVGATADVAAHVARRDWLT